MTIPSPERQALLGQLRELVDQLAKQDAASAPTASEPTPQPAPDAQLALVLMDALPHPVMVVRRDRTIVAANESARTRGAVVGAQCCSHFAHAYLPDPAHSELFGGGCAFCRADEALNSQRAVISPRAEAFDGRLWEIYWIPLDQDSYVHYAIDIAPRERREELLRHQGLHQAVARIASGLAREMNDRLGAIGLFAQALEAAVPADSKLRRDIEGIIEATEKGSRLTRNLLLYSHPTSQADAQPVRLDELLADLAEYLHLTAHDRITCHVEIAPQLWRVTGQTADLRQALTNIVDNAIEAMPDGGTLTIAATNLGGDGGDGGDGAVRHVLLRLIDTGEGMATETLSSACEPFFSTRTAASGARGLGLSAARGLIERLGGTLALDSAPAKGTTATVRLPALRRPSAEAPRAARTRMSSLKAPNVEGSILLVDDDPLFRRAGERALRTLGYSVIVADSGKAALARLLERVEAVALALVDFRMPDRDGQQVAAELKAIAPNLPVILTSGYGKERFVPRPDAPHFDAFLQKPFSAERLANAIREVLGDKKLH